MNTKQTLQLLIVLIVIVGAIVYLNNGKVGPGGVASNAVDVALPEIDAATSTVSAVTVPATTTATMAEAPTNTMTPTALRLAKKAKEFPRAKEISNPSGFVNTNGLPITLSQYVGKKVILLDIMTYSCINCIRTFPYLVDWYKKYEDKGLVIIGIHTPEFDFEKNIDNVTAAMKKYGITFPVVLDNDYGTWTAYGNLYWPRKYLIDIDGFIRADHIGEGGYDETEKMIQDLLKERADVLGTTVNVDMPVTTGAVEQGIPGQSPETYFGSARNTFLGNPSKSVGIGESGQATFEMPAQKSYSKFYLDGTWNIVPDYAENVSVPARIVYPFAARHVYLVASADVPVTVNVTVDGKPLGSSTGADVTEKNGTDTFTVSGSRLYDIYSGSEFGIHTLELSPQSKGLKAFTFTFGN